MKAVILAGGFGTRISEETHLKPKPMIEIGGKPILWHIMKTYSAHGVNDFIICCGYEGYVIKEYFANYFLHMSDVTFDMAANHMEVHERHAEPWRVTLVDTGEDTQTGGDSSVLRPICKVNKHFVLPTAMASPISTFGPASNFTKPMASWPLLPPCSRRGASVRFSSTVPMSRLLLRNRAAMVG